ncbi:MAG: hypothetical protein E7668_03825 [Ruminococcaceae bacterium]|nr:hypothetical protein [Oscillospiraceae bacterium]
MKRFETDSRDACPYNEVCANMGRATTGRPYEEAKRISAPVGAFTERPLKRMKRFGTDSRGRLSLQRGVCEQRTNSENFSSKKGG